MVSANKRYDNGDYTEPAQPGMGDSKEPTNSNSQSRVIIVIFIALIVLVVGATGMIAYFVTRPGKSLSHFANKSRSRLPSLYFKVSE